MILRRPRPVRARVLLPAAALTATLAAGLLAGCASAQTPGSPSGTTTVAAPAPSPSAAADELSYPGQDGKTALELLLAADPSAQVTGTGKNAFVTGIKGRVADDAKHEFWALSVDGKQAQVGAGSLVTQTGQTITWKIETY